MRIGTRIPTRLVLALSAFALAAGCGDDNGDVTGLDPNEFELSIVSGGGSSGIASTVVTEPLVVEVTRRATGAPEQGVRVDWSVIGGVGKPTRPSSATRADGRASTLVELGEAAGAVRLRASVPGLPSVTFPDLTVLPTPTLASVSPASADPGDTVEVRVNDLPSGFSSAVLFDGVAGDIVNLQPGSPAVITAEVPAPIGVCSTDTEAVDVRVRVGGVTTTPLTLSVSVPVDPFEVGQVLVVEAPDSASGDVECAQLPSDAGTAKYLLVALSGALERTGQFQVTLGSGSVAVSGLSDTGFQGEQGFHTGLRRMEQRLLARNTPLATPAPAAAAQLMNGSVPEIGSQRDFWVINDETAAGDSLSEDDFDRITATLRFSGANTLLYVDERAPTGGLTEADIEELGVVYDELLFEADLDFFGEASDVDGNGRVIFLLTPTVNSLTPAGSEGFVVGFFFGLDIFDPNTAGCAECRFSNGGEVLYGVVPDPDGEFSDPRTTERVQELLAGVSVHETQHMINFNWKVLENNLLGLETLWLSEAEAHMAEEFGGDLSDAEGRTELANDLYAANFGRAARYLAEPESFSLTGVSGSGSLGERGGWWLFMRWIADQYGDFILRDLTQALQNGVSNVEVQTGEDFFRLFADFAVAIWADDQEIAGLTERHQIPKWDLRSIIRVEPDGGGDPIYPLEPEERTFETFQGSSITRSMAATSAFYLILEAGNNLGDLQLQLEAGNDAGLAILRFE